MRVKFHPEVETELTENTLFYETKVSGLGFRFINEIERYSALLSEHPEIGQVIDENIRHLVFEQFPYSFIYTIEPEYIWILAIAHHHKKPGYWRERLDR